MNKDVQKKKKFYPISGRLRNYLSQYKREISLAVQYENLLQSVDAYPLMNEKNEDTLWQSMVYDQHYGKEIFEGLKKPIPHDFKINMEGVVKKVCFG